MSSASSGRPFVVGCVMVGASHVHVALRNTTFRFETAADSQKPPGFKTLGRPRNADKLPNADEFPDVGCLSSRRLEAERS
ncbi:Uncharacterised protein [Mycobacteroides abscessus subsp. abscessus]|nr:Uncharacterised protein [Mycobacteroides abscessus subsp. abscessus]